MWRIRNKEWFGTNPIFLNINKLEERDYRSKWKSHWMNGKIPVVVAEGGGSKEKDGRV